MHVTPRTTARVAGSVLALGMGTLGQGVLSAPASAAAAKDIGWIRAGHLALGTGEVDVRLTPYKGGTPRVLEDVDYAEVTPFQRVPQGLYTVALVPAGASADASPMVSRTVRVDKGTASTVIATGPEGDVTADVVRDDLTPPPAGQARVRLVSAATSQAPVQAQVVNGPLLAEDVQTGQATGYATVPAQEWSIKVRAGSQPRSRVTGEVTVASGGVYTLLVLDRQGGGIELQAVQDSSGSTSAKKAGGAMPKGGVDTGAGGLAVSDAAGPGTGTLAGLAGLTAAGVLLLRRRLADQAR